MHLLFPHPVLGSTVYWEEIPPPHSVSDSISSTFFQNLTGLAMLQILLKEKHLEGSGDGEDGVPERPPLLSHQ